MKIKKNKDTLYTGPGKPGETAKFRFDATIAGVFDDMIVRSVPGYEVAQGLISAYVRCFSLPNSKIYDLGCSTGNTLRTLDAQVLRNCTLVACDSSPEMLEKCQDKLSNPPLRHDIEYLRHDCRQPITLDNCSVAIASLLLQFIEPSRRRALIKEIFGQLLPGGALIIFEKTHSPEPRLDALARQWHEGFKRTKGYSQDEIARKRQALENVLVTWTMDENIDQLRQAGFESIEIFFCMANFFAAVAVKPGHRA